jgi:glycosyltransferase involved in cell wall biosynthesis
MLLIVAQLTDPNNSSTGYYWEKIVETLSKKEKILLVTEEKSSKLEKNSEVQILQVSIPNFLKNNLYLEKGFLPKLIISLKMLFFSIVNSKNKENILIGTNPFLIVLLPIFLRVFFIKTKISILVFDLFPENLISTSKSFVLKNISLMIKKFFDFAYRRFHKVFSIGKDMTEILVHKNINPQRIIYCPNWCDDDYSSRADEKKALLKSLGIEYESTKNIVILYFGNLGYFQNLEIFIDIISKTKNKDLIFLFVGNGVKKNLIFEAAKLDNRIHHRDGVALSDRSKILLSGDISLVTLSDEMLGLAVPSKSYFSLAYGMPLLTIMNKKSEISSLVEENNFGWNFSSSETEEVSNFLESLTHDDIRNKQRDIFFRDEKFRSSKSLDVFLKNLV